MASSSSQSRPGGSDRRQFVDLYQLIVEYANNYKTVKDLRKSADLKNIRDEDIDLRRFKVVHQPTDFSDLGDAPPPVASSQTVFSSEMINDTSNPQKLTVSSARKTTSTCRVSMQRALTLGGSLAVTLSAPGSLLSTNAAFKRDLTLTDSSEATMQEELTWSINCEVNVAGRTKTTAEIEIEESELSGSFRVDTQLSGKICILIRDKKTGEVIAPIVVGDVSQVFTEEKGFVPLAGSQGVVRFTQVGDIFCRFGVNQRIRFKEEPLPEACDDESSDS